MPVDSPINAVKGVGPALAQKLAAVGIRTVSDLYENYPRRYEDYSVVMEIASLQPGPVTIQARIEQVSGRYVRRGMHVTEAVAADATGSVRLVWFNQPYRATSLAKNTAYFISGSFELRQQRLNITNPAIERVSDLPLNVARIVSVYRETKGLTSRNIRSLMLQIAPVMTALPETLPGWLVDERKLMTRAQSIRAIHLPESAEDLAAARRRLGFEEVFQLTLAALLSKYELMHEQAPSVPFVESIARDFVAALPFSLTSAQRKIAWQIFKDMQRKRPMNRLVEGDVGSGKTVVAALAASMVLHNQHQVACMAPTELLARQHAASLQDLLRPVGQDQSVGLLVGGMTPAQKDRARAHIQAGDIRLIVGTQALIQEAVTMTQLELVIIDEQHRFGVNQRAALQSKAGHTPHVLSLTATPIPRTLALTLYGDLDISILDVKPPGRTEIQTTIISPHAASQVYATIDEQLAAGRQLFVVCPLISASTTVEARSAEQVYDTLRSGPFKHRRVALLHGKMKSTEKHTIMTRFVAHEFDILVSTTVIEVGVDVPNATVMLIEGVERFGLAQLHQLRGRVGRGSHQSYCYLMLSESKPVTRRLRALEQSNDGFKLAELDLEIRGPGAIYGNLQHGQLDLRIAQLTDIQLISEAQAAAQTFLDRQENLLHYDHLFKHISHLQAITNLN